jgi:hypothetical protein
MKRIVVCTIVAVLLSCGVAAAQKVSTETLLDLGRARSPKLEQALRDTLGDDAIGKGTAAAGKLGEFVWAVTSEKGPQLRIDNEIPVSAWRVGGLWVYQGHLRMGTAHKFAWIIDGKPFGGNLNLKAFGPESYPQSGVPQGKLTGPVEFASTIYPNMKANVWYYVPTQWDGVTALPVQIWGDGQFYTMTRDDQYHILDTLDNLTAQKRIPLMVNVFIQPGTGAAQNQRSIEYDSVDDRYARYLLEEILPEINKRVKLRRMVTAGRWLAKVPAVSARSMQHF